MTPQARIAAAIDILDRILAGDPAERALLGWSRASRFAGSGDRGAIRDLVFEALRRRRSYAALGGAVDGAETGRNLMLGHCRAHGLDPDGIFTGQGHAPPPLTAEERVAGAAPTTRQAADLPDWLWPDWADSLGEDAATIAAALRDRAPVWLRVNPRRASPDVAQAQLASEGIETQAWAALSGALRVISGERRVSGSTAYRDGLVELQDLSPQLACAAVPLQDGQRVLDFCAGGGGKSLALGGRARVKLFAHDADPGRMADLPARAARAGIAIYRVARPSGQFDLVVADVPCSGSGTWRRGPDAKWRLRREDLDRLVGLQRDILDQVAPLVRQGGHLAYMTCSLFNLENDNQIQRFISDNSSFTSIFQRRWTPLDASDGFFLALLRREG